MHNLTKQLSRCVCGDMVCCVYVHLHVCVCACVCVYALPYVAYICIHCTSMLQYRGYTYESYGGISW